LPNAIKTRKTIGIRIPANNIIRTIIKELGNPMLTKSLKNIDSMSEYETDPELIEEKYGHVADLIIDGGFGDTIASTIVDCTNENIEITRQGAYELIL
jgi:tRNA A37 threonylcarbamoyladenosine synthetase subunit TsaC/SUA5/YrdC